MAQDLLLRGSGPDILIRDGIIFKTGYGLSVGPSATVLNTSGLTVSPGFVDLHVHFREPGYSYKETILTGSRAAARGGYTTVCTMPNLKPAPDTEENISVQQSIIDRDAVVQVLPYACITLGRQGVQTVDFASLKGSCVAFSDDGSGVQDREVMRQAMRECAALDCIIAAHCEDNTLLHGGYIHKGRYAASHGHKGICSESEYAQIARDLELSADTGCRYHVCHISTKESVELIRQAKRSGVRVSCETAPHYLCLCEDDLQEDGRFKMNPPLRSAEDRDALIEGLKDGTIDAIATDHAPHSLEEKSKGLEFSAMGVSGLECAFSALNTFLVKTGKVELGTVLRALTDSPRKVFSLEGRSLNEASPADITILDTECDYILKGDEFLSKGHSTPFEGMRLSGKVVCTIKSGSIVWADDSILSQRYE